MERSRLCLWRPLTRSAGRACVGPGSGALGTSCWQTEGMSQCSIRVSCSREEKARGKEKHTLNRSSEGQAMIPTPLVTAPDSSLYQLNPKHQQYQYYSPHSEKEDTEAQRGSHSKVRAMLKRRLIEKETGMGESTGMRGRPCP